MGARSQRDASGRRVHRPGGDVLVEVSLLHDRTGAFGVGTAASRSPLDGGDQRTLGERERGRRHPADAQPTSAASANSASARFVVPTDQRREAQVGEGRARGTCSSPTPPDRELGLGTSRPRRRATSSRAPWPRTSAATPCRGATGRSGVTRSAAAAQRSAATGSPPSAPIHAAMSARPPFRAMTSSPSAVEPPTERGDPPDPIRARAPLAGAARPLDPRRRSHTRGPGPARAARAPRTSPQPCGGARGSSRARVARAPAQHVAEQVVVPVPLAADDRAGRAAGSVARSTRGSGPSPTDPSRRRTPLRSGARGSTFGSGSAAARARDARGPRSGT